MSTFDARLTRVNTTVGLKEPDRVPIMPSASSFAVMRAGHTMADITYDPDKGIEAVIDYMLEFQPDGAPGFYTNLGKGPMFELMNPKSVRWAGAPPEFEPVEENSTHQFIEFPVLLEEEMDLFCRDYTGWVIRYGMPKVSGLLEPFANWNVSSLGVGYDLSPLASQLARPEMRHIIETLWKIDDMNKVVAQKTAAARKRMEELGFPIFTGGGAGVPYDSYTDFYRGTFDTFIDLFEHRDVIEQFCEARLELTLQNIRAAGKLNPGKWVSMPLHKGMDGFMDEEQYKNLYWKDLRRIIEEIIAVGMVPYIYTEGPYNTRLDFLTEVEPNKVIYHFETVDMAEAKRKLGNIACISGGFSLYILHYCSKQQVIDECKRLIDICAPGGGFIFETAAGFDNAPEENVRAMFETVKTYGVYK